MTWRRQSLRRDETYQYYAPRPTPTPIPAERWNEGEMRCLQVNHTWVAHILGVMEALDQPDTWEGTEAEIEDARAQVNEIMAALGDCQMITTRYNPDSGLIEVYDPTCDCWYDAPYLVGLDDVFGISTKTKAAWGIAKALWFEDMLTLFWQVKDDLENSRDKTFSINAIVNDRSPYDETAFRAALSDLWDYAAPDPTALLAFADFNGIAPDFTGRVASELYYSMLYYYNPGVMGADEWTNFRFRLGQEVIEQPVKAMLYLVASNELAANIGRNRSRFAYQWESSTFEDFFTKRCHLFDWTAGNTEWTVTTGTQDSGGIHSVDVGGVQTIEIDITLSVEAYMFTNTFYFTAPADDLIDVYLKVGSGHTVNNEVNFPGQGFTTSVGFEFVGAPVVTDTLRFTMLNTGVNIGVPFSIQKYNLYTAHGLDNGLSENCA